MVKMKSVLFLFVCSISAFCCVGPDNIEGVAFTSGELIDLSKIESIGVYNVNMIKDTSGGSELVKYRSHSNPDAMVFVGRTSMIFAKNIKLNCMGILFDRGPLPEGSAVANRVKFNFVEALRVELQWLTQNGVVVLQQDVIDSIVSKLSPENNGGMQYWTLQKRALAYNSWYEYDTLNSVWSINGVNSIKSVRTDGGCGIVSVDFILPLETLGAVKAKNTLSPKNSGIKIIQDGNKNLMVRFNSVSEGRTKLTIVNLSGKKFSESFFENSRQVSNISLSSIKSTGIYYAIIANAECKETLPFMILK